MARKFPNEIIIKKLQQDKNELVAALKTFRSLVDDGGVPRYNVTPGAALNSVIEEVVDPVLRRLG